MTYGKELIEKIERDIEATKAEQARRAQNMDDALYDLDDCFISVRLDETSIRTAQEKLTILRDGGFAWFTEFALLDGTLCRHHEAHTRYGFKTVVETPNGETIWVGSWSQKALLKKGLKLVRTRRPAWVCLKSSGKGLYGAAMAYPEVFPSDTNYWTGEPASDDPVEVKDAD